MHYILPMEVESDGAPNDHLRLTLIYNRPRAFGVLNKGLPSVKYKQRFVLCRSQNQG